MSDPRSIGQIIPEVLDYLEHGVHVHYTRSYTISLGNYESGKLEVAVDFDASPDRTPDEVGELAAQLVDGIMENDIQLLHNVTKKSNPKSIIHSLYEEN